MRYERVGSRLALVLGWCIGIVLAMGPMSGYGDRTDVSCENRTHDKYQCSKYNGNRSKCEAAKALHTTRNGCAGSDDTIHVYYPCMCTHNSSEDCAQCGESETEKCSNKEEKVKSCVAGERGS